MNNAEFRRKLSKISKIKKPEDDASFINLTEKLLNDLKEIQPDHKVSVIPDTSKSLQNFNCYEYALGLSESKEYIDIKNELTEAHFGSVFCNSRFVQWLIHKKYLQGPKDNNLILYFDYKKIVHAGTKENDGMIISKWGTDCLFKHSEEEVPEEYGNEYRYYKAPEMSKIVEHFKEYLKELSSLINNLLVREL